MEASLEVSQLQPLFVACQSLTEPGNHQSNQISFFKALNSLDTLQHIMSSSLYNHGDQMIPRHRLFNYVSPSGSLVYNMLTREGYQILEHGDSNGGHVSRIPSIFTKLPATPLAQKAS